MKITLKPQRRDDTLTVSKQGDTLTINGEALDFSQLPDGATLPKDAVGNPFIASDVERIDGELHLSLLLPYGRGASNAAKFPEPIINPADGELELPK